MMILGASAAMLIVALQSGQAPVGDPSQPLDIEIVARTYRADGRIGGAAGDSGAAGASGYVWGDEQLCGLSASGVEAASSPFVGWHFNARLANVTANEFVVDVEWQRVWDKGGRSTLPRSAVVQAKLKPGDRFELDRAMPGVASACGAASLRLEIGLVARPNRRGFLMPPNSSLSGAVVNGSGGAGAGASAGRGGAGGAGAVLRVSGGSNSAAQSDADQLRAIAAAMLEAAARLKARGDASVVEGSLSASLEDMRKFLAQPVYDAEVWLVHKLPDGTEEVQRQNAQFASAASFSFAPVLTSTPQGRLEVRVSGSLQLSPGTLPLTVKIVREATAYTSVPSTSPRATAVTAYREATGSSAGRSSTQLDLPKAGDVVSFEMPRLNEPYNSQLAGHTFSLRLLLRPRSPAPAR